MIEFLCKDNNGPYITPELAEAIVNSMSNESMKVYFRKKGNDGDWYEYNLVELEKLFKRCCE